MPHSVTGNTASGKESLHQSNRATGGAGKNNHPVGSNSYQTDRSCELEFGSHCLWSRERREESLTLEVKLHIQDHERMLCDAVSDYDLQPFMQVKILEMDEAIAKAKAHSVDCYNVDRKLRQILDLTEDEAHFHMKQSAFLYQIGVQTMSKTFHCLSMRLTVEYFKSPSADTEHSISNKIDDPRFQHCVIFSRSILALSVTINSTVVNSEVQPSDLGLLYFDMKDSVPHINQLYCITGFWQHERHIILVESWLGGKVNGAVEYCGIKLSELESYLDTDRYDGNSCAWMSGINVLNLEKWREHDITGKYQRFLRQLQLHHENEASWRAEAIQASLLVFHDQIYALDDILFEQGLGHDFQVCKSNVKNAAVLHFDGNMKPWLDLGIPKYKKRGLWKNAMLIYKSKCRIKLKQSPSTLLVSNFKKLPILNFKALRTAFEESPADLEWEVSDGSWLMRLII
ncbi:hypothetical protein ZIOFF_060488 [Zingiber officinale]|uniref:Hexosyltransferase n=1 Tax=Zingiber officinale TaxID=94328 RepID=A0A8J5FP19_ZINOF|nr:hypothetical protein ZIOFF_060488 [Zingiber officinale]